MDQQSYRDVVVPEVNDDHPVVTRLQALRDAYFGRLLTWLVVGNGAVLAFSGGKIGGAEPLSVSHRGDLWVALQWSMGGLATAFLTVALVLIAVLHQMRKARASLALHEAITAEFAYAYAESADSYSIVSWSAGVAAAISLACLSGGLLTLCSLAGEIVGG